MEKPGILVLQFSIEMLIPLSDDLDFMISPIRNPLFHPFFKAQSAYK